MNDITVINEKFIQTVKDFSMIEPNDTIIAAVSGGADSMALLYAIANLLKDYNLTIIAAHLNHGIRGKEALRDENFVRSYCKENNIKCEVCHKDIPQIAKEQSIGVEECGRNERYKFFFSLAEKYNAKIATGHTLSDKVETMMFNIIRGCGLNGLKSIAPKRGIIIRPIINLSREETEKFCKANQVGFILDSTNLQTDYTRNKIRLEIISEIKKINPNFENTALRLMENAYDDNEFIANQAIEIFNKAKTDNGLNLDFLENVNKSVLSRVINLFAGSNCEKKHIELIKKLINRECNAVNIKGNRIVYIKNNILQIKECKKNKNYSKEWKQPLTTGDIYTQANRKFTITILNIQDYNNLLKEKRYSAKDFIDYDKLCTGSFFRKRIPGDKFKSYGNSITKKLKKLLNESSLSEFEKSDLLILESDNKIAWIENFGVSDYVKVDNKTKNIILIQ
ncbi:MAG: tRNA lysidine(34) synthetase TilS [Clostridia bacterium]|nr:tRNA lysidine(34) synthetase TilS [Clostridia bacterium]